MIKEQEEENEPKLIKGVLLKGKELVRICNPDKIHYKYEWHDGENIDILPFKAEGECSEGGLYFTTLEHLLYFNDYMRYLGNHWFVRVTVDDNEDVWQEPNGKWKAHRVMVTSMTRIKDMTEEVLYKMATSDLQRRLGWISKPFDSTEREELWCEILELRPLFLQFVRNQTDKMCLVAVASNYCLIQFVYDPVIIVKLASKLDIVHNITDWTCDLVDAFLASGQCKFYFQFYDADCFMSSYKPDDLKKMLNLNEEHEYRLYVNVIDSKSDSSSETCIMHPTQELVNHIYEKVYNKNKK